MKVAEVCSAQAEFAASKTPAFDQSSRAQMVQVFSNAFAKDDVAYPHLQVAPGMINVHFIPLLSSLLSPAALAHLGRLSEAQAAVQNALNPSYTITRFCAVVLYAKISCGAKDAVKPQMRMNGALAWVSEHAAYRMSCIIAASKPDHLERAG